MVEVLRRVAYQVGARTPLILVGLPGTGRTELSRVVHQWSGRRGQLVCYEPGQADPDSDRDALCGEEPQGTGGMEHHAALLEENREGTVVLKDFEALRASTQKLLLDAVDPAALRSNRVGVPGPVGSRLIIHLRHAPDLLVANGVLTDAVRLRLGYGAIRLPPLDERRDDIPALAHVFLERCEAETAVSGPKRFDHAAIEVLQAAQWPGNLWQLRLVIREAYLRASGAPVLRVEHFSDLVRFAVRFERRGSSAENAHAIRFALQLTHGRAREAARLLGAAPSTIYRYQAERRTGAD